MGTEKTRAEKNRWYSMAFEEAKKQRKTLNVEKILADFAIQNISSRRTALELLHIFEVGEAITIDNGVIKVK